MDGKNQLEVLEKEKERMIQRYLELQDRADDLNEVIYRLCCDIEVLNARIRVVQEELRRVEIKVTGTQAVKAPPSNGTSGS